MLLRSAAGSAAFLLLAAAGAWAEPRSGSDDRTARELGCTHLCGGNARLAGIPALCQCVNWHALMADGLHAEIERTCGGGSDAAWAASAGKDMLVGWAHGVTAEVCLGRDEEGAPPCNFDAAVKTLYDRGGVGGKSVDLQCAFSLLGWSVDPNPMRDQVFGHPARRLGHSGKLGKGPQVERGKWPHDIQTIIDGTAQRYFKTKKKKKKKKKKKGGILLPKNLR
jgi:hypothetical protein